MDEQDEDEGQALEFLSLSGQSSIQAEVSDHHPLVNKGLLFFNMMMQAHWNPEKMRFNNGFGILDESQSHYHERIKAVVRILAEIAYLNPHLYVIGLAEAPIKEEDIAVFREESLNYPSLKRFCRDLNLSAVSAFGVLTLIDTERFEAASLPIPRGYGMETRAQSFILSSKSKEHKYFQVSNVHLPFDLAKKENKAPLFCFLRHLVSGEVPHILMGDFNMSPQTILQKLEDATAFIPDNNNVLMDAHLNKHYESVDGILYSHQHQAVLPQYPTVVFNVMKYFLSCSGPALKLLKDQESEKASAY